MMRRWYSYWDLRAARRNIADMRFRESNGEILPTREWREANSWQEKAQAEYEAARS